MIRHLRALSALSALAGSMLVVPMHQAAAQQAPTTQQAPAPHKHHSVAKGAVAGAVAGHMTHRRHGAVAGAAIGAAVQHHRNKKAERAAAPPSP